jgi:hypothetical protein
MRFSGSSCSISERSHPGAPGNGKIADPVDAPGGHLVPEMFFADSVPSLGENVLGLARSTIARRHGDCYLALGTHLCLHPGQRPAVSELVPIHRRCAAPEADPPDYCGERTAMMPKRHRTRAQNRAHRIATERRQNHHARVARWADCMSYDGPAPPHTDHDPPPSRSRMLTCPHRSPKTA